MEQAAGARCIDQELCLDRKCCAVSKAAKDRARFATHEVIEFHLVEISDSQFLGLLDEEGVEVGSEPMGVRDLVARACGHQKLIVIGRVRIVGCIEPVAIEREAALKPASNMRTIPLPATPFCERRYRWQIVATAEVFKQKICQWSRRFPNDDAWMLGPFQQHDGIPEPFCDHGNQRSGEPGSGDGDVVGLGQLCLSHSLHSTASSTCW